MNRKRISELSLVGAFILIVVSLIIDWSITISSICRCVSLFFLFLVAFINFGWCPLVRFIRDLLKIKERCSCYSKEDCPYGDKSECVYDTTNCRAFDKRGAKKQKCYLWPLLILSLCITIFFELTIENHQLQDIFNDFDANTLYKILQPILNSFIAAIIVSLLIDIPGRMKEYQTYFVELLSSSDYLKKMTETELTNLRKEVTWLLHVKDYPNMPKKLIDMDERFCRMLKMPYYKEYSQTVIIQKADNSYLRKKVSIEYTAFNPQHKDNPVSMDIGFCNSLCFDTDVSTDNAKKMFVIKKLTCAFDNFEQEKDLTPFVRIGVSKENRDGFMYNGRVALMPLGTSSNKENPLNVYAMVTNSGTDHEVKYESIEESGKAHLFISFHDKIKVKIQCEILVPDTDISYTKRLRYPAKYFHLDYRIAGGIDYTVVGQLIGTLMDQPDVTIDVSEDKKSIKMNTHNWLLPKNGAVIVHCKA